MQLIRRWPSISGESKTYQVYACILSIVPIATVFFFLRVYARSILRKTWGWDDNFLLLGVLGLWGSFAVAYLMLRLGLGHHVYNIPQDVFYQYGLTYIHLTWASIILYTVTNAMIKISTCLLYLRVFSMDRPAIALRVTIVVVILYTIFGCSAGPIACGVNGETNKPNCAVTMNVYLYLTGVLNIVCDAWLVGLVVFQMLQLQMPWQRKAKIMVLPVMGLAIVGAAIMRLVRSTQAGWTPDYTWDNVPVSVYSFIEMGVGVVCVSLGGCGPLIEKWHGKAKESMNSLRSRSKGTESVMDDSLISQAPKKGESEQREELSYGSQQSKTYRDSIADLEKG